MGPTMRVPVPIDDHTYYVDFRLDAVQRPDMSLNITTTAPHEPIVQDFQTLMALAGL